MSKSNRVGATEGAGTGYGHRCLNKLVEAVGASLGGRVRGVNGVRLMQYVCDWRDGLRAEFEWANYYVRGLECSAICESQWCPRWSKYNLYCLVLTVYRLVVLAFTRAPPLWRGFQGAYVFAVSCCWAILWVALRRGLCASPSERVALYVPKFGQSLKTRPFCAFWVQKCSVIIPTLLCVGQCWG